MRLRSNLEEEGFVVVYVEALKYRGPLAALRIARSDVVVRFTRQLHPFSVFDSGAPRDGVM